MPAVEATSATCTTLSRSVAEIANVTPIDHQPYVGHSAFAHKGGMHVTAVAKVARSYEHIDPGLVGNVSRAASSRELGGRAQHRASRPRSSAHDLDGARRARRLSPTIKELENEGYAVRGRRGLLRAAHPPQGRRLRSRPSEIVDYTVLSEQRDGPASSSAEATVKVRVDGEVVHTVAEGNGPVNALDTALRKALGEFFPQLELDAPRRLQGAHHRRHGRPRRPHPRPHRFHRRGPGMVDDGIRHEHHLRVSRRPGGLLRVRHLEARRRWSDRRADREAARCWRRAVRRPVTRRPEPAGTMSGTARLDVAFAGEPGSFAEDAVLAAYPGAVALPVPLFEDVVRVVAEGAAAAGVLPIENVVGGGVREVYDLLLDSQLAVVGEVIVPVRLCLAALPGQAIEDIERVYSHIQALSQAEPFLRSRAWTLLAATNTAGSGTHDRGPRRAGLRGGALTAGRDTLRAAGAGGRHPGGAQQPDALPGAGQAGLGRAADAGHR